MPDRKTLDGSASGLLLLLCTIWALQQIFLKAAAADIAPTFQIAVRSGVAAVVVGVLLWCQGLRLVGPLAPWQPGLVVGMLFALEFWFVGEGLRYTSASHMVIFLYTAPIFVALALHWKCPSERLSKLQWVGVALAFGGIAFAFLQRSGTEGGATSTPSDIKAILWGDFLALLAGLAWAATTVTVRLTRLNQASAGQTVWYQLACAFVFLAGVSLATDQTYFHSSPIAWSSLVFQSLVLSVFSYLSWFWLLRRYLASQLGVFSFLTPVLGVTLGVVVLGDTLMPSFVIGAALVCSGITLVHAHAWWQRRRSRGQA